MAEKKDRVDTNIETQENIEKLVFKKNSFCSIQKIFWNFFVSYGS